MSIIIDPIYFAGNGLAQEDQQMTYELIVPCIGLTFPAVSEGMMLVSVPVYYTKICQSKVRCYGSEQQARYIDCFDLFITARRGSGFGMSPHQTLALIAEKRPDN